MDWIETKLRKGTKIPKICRDMFIATSTDNSYCTLCVVKNGNMVKREEINNDTFLNLIREHNLVPMYDSVFRKAITYRTRSGKVLVERLKLWASVHFA